MPAEGEGESESDADCEDPVLGGFVLAPGYSVVDSAVLPSGTAAVAVGGFDQEAPHLFGLGDDLVVYDLGAWPELTGERERLFDVRTAGDAALEAGAEVFPSFLVMNGTGAATGYTRASDYGGAVAKHTLDDVMSLWLDAPANFSAAIVGDVLMVNGAGIDTTELEGLGLYGWSEDATFQIADLGDGSLGSGYLAATATGVVVAGRFTGENELFAISPDAVADRMAGGAVIDLGAATPFLTGGYSSLAGFGDGVAIVTFDVASYQATGLVDVALPLAGGAVTPGKPAPVLRLREGCITALPFVSTHGADVLVGVASDDSTRAVRIARE